MEKEKRKQQSGRQIPKVVYVLVALALIVGIIVGIRINRESAVVVEEAITQTPSATSDSDPIDVPVLQTQSATSDSNSATSDSNTVDLPVLQTQWAELDITKTAVTESRVTPTPK